jgi:hypothetical protein
MCFIAAPPRDVFAGSSVTPRRDAGGRTSPIS